MDDFQEYVNERPTGRGDISFDPAERRTKDDGAKEADLNYQIQRMMQTGIPIEQRPSVAQYMDLGDAPSYQEMLNSVTQAREAFEALPSALRDKYGNSVPAFLSSLQTESGQKELIRYGLATPHQPPKDDPSVAALKASTEALVAVTKASKGRSRSSNDDS